MMYAKKLNLITVFIPEGGAPELVDHIKDNFAILNKFMYKIILPYLI